ERIAKCNSMSPRTRLTSCGKSAAKPESESSPARLPDTSETSASAVGVPAPRSARTYPRAAAPAPPSVRREPPTVPPPAGGAPGAGQHGLAGVGSQADLRQHPRQPHAVAEDLAGDPDRRAAVPRVVRVHPPDRIQNLVHRREGEQPPPRRQRATEPGIVGDH